MKKTLLTVLAGVTALWTFTGCTTHREYRGQLVDESGQPIRNALVAIDEDGTERASGKSDKQGNFEVGFDEPGGFGCGALSEGYTLTLKTSDDPKAAFATLRGPRFSNLGQVKLLDHAPEVAIEDGTITMTSTTLGMWIDDGLGWDVSGVGAMPVEALGQAGMHTFRRSERQIVGEFAAPLETHGPAVEVNVPASAQRLALLDGGFGLADNSFAPINMFDQSSQTIALATRSRVRAIFLAGLRSDSDLAQAKPLVEVMQGGETTQLSDVACSLHATTVMCVGDYDNVDSIKVRLTNKDGFEQYFRAGEALVY